MTRLPAGWRLPFLAFRLNAYLAAGDPRATRADRDLRAFLRHFDPPLDQPTE